MGARLCEGVWHRSGWRTKPASCSRSPAVLCMIAQVCANPTVSAGAFCTKNSRKLGVILGLDLEHASGCGHSCWPTDGPEGPYLHPPRHWVLAALT